jgi:carbonic anhydrase
MTISSDDLVRRNAGFAATGAFVGLPFPTNDTLQVLGCVDSRVDPSDVLGLKLGEGVVMRNIGGRITPGDAALMGPAGPAWPGPAPEERALGDPAPHRLRHHPPRGLP